MAKTAREILQNNNAVESVLNNKFVIEEIEGVLDSGAGDVAPSDSFSEGFGSIVIPLLLNGEPTETVVKIPKISAEKPVEQAYKSLVYAGVQNVIGMWLVGKEGVTKLPLGDDGVVDETKIDSQSVVRSEYLFLLLKELPKGNNCLELMINNDASVDWLDVYADAGRVIRELHESTVSNEVVSNTFWRTKAVAHVITADERYRAISSLDFLQEAPWFSSDEKGSLVRKMGAVARMDFQNGNNPIRRIHGDNWEANWWLSNTGEVILFDNALAFGHAGYDAGFAIGKQLIRSLVNKSEDANRNIAAFINNYGQEMWGEAQKTIWNPLAFKMVVGAAFDGYEPQVKARLIKYAHSLLDYRLDRQQAEFDLQLAKGLWNAMD